MTNTDRELLFRAILFRAILLGTILFGPACARSGPDYREDIRRALETPRTAAAAKGMNIAPGQPAPRPFLRIKNHNPAGYLKREGIPHLFTLGEIAFRSPLLFGGRARHLGLSCRSCHPNGGANTRFFIPGNSSRPGTVDVSHVFFGSGRENGIADAVRIPDLRGIRFRAPYGHDGRSQSLREFTRHVIRGEFAGGEPTALILDALEAYIREFEFLPVPGLSENGEPRVGPHARSTAAARRGHRIFMKNCAGCHPPSRWFRDGRVHRLGTKKKVSPWAVEGGVKTPTLLGLREKGLFHDASLADAKAAIEWFNRRDKLNLGAGARGDLEAYLRLVAASEQPLDGRGSGERLLELVSTLRFFESAARESFPTAIYDFFLASLIIDYIREMKTLRRPASREAAGKILRGLRELHDRIRSGVSASDMKRALLLEKQARELFSRRIMK